MCPDKETISAYIDGELDPKWAGVIRSHGEECSSCAEEISRLDALAGFLRSDIADIDREAESARERVRQGIWHERNQRYYRPVPLRFFGIPAPALALVAVCSVIIGAAGMFFLYDSFQVHEPAMASVPDEDDFRSVEDLMAFLETHEQGINITIQLPEEPMFIVVGEPQLLRTADYRRGD